MVKIPQFQLPKFSKPQKTNRSKASKKRNTIDWLEEAPLVPRLGTPAVDHIERRARRMRGAIYASLALGVVASLGLVTSVSNSKTPTAPTQIELTSPGRNVATASVQAWLSENPSPLPGGSILSWDGATTISGKSGKVELDTFTLQRPIPNTAQTPTGQAYYYYKATIEISLKGLIPIGGPGLSEMPNSNLSQSNSVVSPWPTVDNLANSVTPSVSQSISGWLQAYTSGSPTQLAVAVGDPNSSHFYTPMYGVQSATYTLVDSAFREAPNVAPVSSNNDPNAQIVEIAVDFHWKGQKRVSSNSGSGGVYGPPTTMDLLIERANTAAPIVVAWGQPGSGPTLQPYENG